MEIIRFLQQFANPIMDKFFVLVTLQGEDIFFILSLTFVFWCVNKKLAYKIAFAYMLNGVANSVVKGIVKAPRPIGAEGIFSLRTETATGYSFPSGHTQSAASFWTSVMLEMRRKWMYVAGTALILLVAISRLYLGVHWPQDVLAGGALGVCLVFLSNRIFEYMEGSDKKHLILIIFLPLVAGMYFLHSQDYYKVAGVVCSFALGYVLDALYIQYEPKALAHQQVIKYGLGMVVIICMKSGLKLVFPDIPVFHFARYFLIGAWICIAAPFIFKYVLKFGKSQY